MGKQKLFSPSLFCAYITFVFKHKKSETEGTIEDTDDAYS